LALLVLIPSCQKQKPSPIEGSYFTRDELRRAKYCEKTNFVTNVLAYKNMINLFQCAAWSEKFPDLFQSLSKINEGGWNHLLLPIGKKFLDKGKQRNQMIRELQILDAKGGLDDLGRVITALNDTNFYDGFYSLLSCARSEESLDECSKRKTRPTDKEIGLALNLVAFTPDIWRNIASMIYFLEQAMKPYQNSYRNSLKKFFTHKSFVPLRLGVLRAYADEFLKSGLKDNDKNFWLKLISKINKDGEPWLASFLTDKLNEEDFDNLFRFSSVQEEDLKFDLWSLKRAYSVGVPCDGVRSDQIKVDVGEHLRRVIDKMHTQTQAEFFDSLIETLTTVHTTTDFCPRLKKNTVIIPERFKGPGFKKYEWDIISFIKTITGFFKKSEYYELIQFIQRIPTEIDPGLQVYFLELLTSNFSYEVTALTKFIYKNSDQFFIQNHKILKNLEKSYFRSLRDVLVSLIEKESVESYKAIYKIISFFNDDELNFLFNFLDKHIDPQTDYLNLLHFYSGAVNIAAEDFSNIFSKFVNEKNLPKTISALESVAKNLRGPSVLQDFKLFFSRDHILKIVEVLTRGVNVSGVMLPDRTAHHKKILNGERFQFKSDDLGITKNQINCIKELSEVKYDLYSMIENPPLVCLGDGHHFVVQSIKEIHDFQDAYRKYMFEKYGVLNELVFDDSSILSPGLFFGSLYSLKLFEFYHGGEEKKIDQIISEIGTELFEDERPTAFFENLEKLFKALSEVSNSTNENQSFYSTIINGLSTEVGFKETEKGILNWLDVISRYTPQKERTINKDHKYDCETYNNLKVGGFPCPTPFQASLGIKRILKRFIKSNERSAPNALTQLLKAMKVGEGLPILDKRSVSINKRLSIKESLELIYEMSDESNSKNKKRVKYIRNPKADKQYFKKSWQTLRKSKDKKGKTSPEVNTLERIEVVIRDIRFDMNYLGAHYMNAVSKSSNYNETVESKHSLLKKCVFVRLCGKPLNRLQRRYGKNAVETFSGLLDANTEWKRGDYMKGLLTAIVSSSAKDAQRSELVGSLPYVLPKKVLNDHNGWLLTHITMLGGLSNSGRVLRDRTGRDQVSFDEFINSEDVKILDENFLRDVNIEEASESLAKLFEAVSKESNLLINEFTQWISTLSYKEQRHFDNILYKLIGITSYIGSPEHFVDKEFKNNNLGVIFSFLGKMSAHVGNFDEFFKGEFLRDNLDEISNVLTFFYEGLTEVEGQRVVNPFYRSLNYLTSFVGYLNSSVDESSLSSFLSSLSSRKNIIELKEVNRSIIKTLKYMSNSSGESVLNLGKLAESLRQVIKHGVAEQEWRSYFKLVSSEMVCEISNPEIGEDCQKNSKFLEPIRLMGFMLKEGRFTGLIRYLFLDKRDSVVDYFSRIFPSIKISVRPAE
jgi:hypothetical protein